MVNFEDQDWEELGDPSPRGARDPATVWKVAVGVAVGMLLGGALVYAVDHRMGQPSLSAAARALEQAVQAADTARAGPPKAAAPMPEQLAAQQDKHDPATPEQGQPPQPTAAPTAPEGGGRDTESTQRVLQRAAEQKERAWARFYIKPAQCDINPGRDTIVECANHFIRARREFEAAYAAGPR